MKANPSDDSTESDQESPKPQVSRPPLVSPPMMLSNPHTQELVTHRVYDVDKPEFSLLRWCFGSWPGIVCLFLAVEGTLIIGGALLWHASGGNTDFDSSWEHSLWLSYTLNFDPGTQTSLGADAPHKLKLLAALLSILGFTFNLVLLGMVVDRVRRAIEMGREHWRKLRLHRHTLILGWNEKTLYLLSELLAQQNSRWGRQDDGLQYIQKVAAVVSTDFDKRDIVVLARADQLEMNESLRRSFETQDLKQSTITCQQGLPWDLDDLVKVSAEAALDIIVVSNGASAVVSDQYVLRTVLALITLKVQGNVFVELRNPENLMVLKRMTSAVEPQRFCGISTRATANKVAMATMLSRSLGLAMCELVTQTGNELYVSQFPKLAGLTMSQVEISLRSAVVVGFVDLSCTLYVRYDQSRKLLETDQLLLLAPELQPLQEISANDCPVTQERRNKVSPSDSQIQKKLQDLPTLLSPHAHIESSLQQHSRDGVCVLCMVGWSSDSPSFMMHLDARAGTISPIVLELHILASHEFGKKIGKTRDQCKHLQIKFVKIGKNDLHGPTSRDALLRLPIQHAHSVMVVSDETRQKEDAEVADCCTLTQGFKLSAAVQDFIKEGQINVDQAPNIVCELLDFNTHKLVATGGLSSTQSSGLDLWDPVFFPSNSVETGLFGTGVNHPFLFNFLHGLIGSDKGHSLSIVTIGELFPQADLRSDWSFLELALVLREIGLVLIGTQQIQHGHRDWRSRLNPKNKSVNRSWDPNDQLLCICSGDEGPMQTASITGMACGTDTDTRN